jgi:hypothetical protein
MRLLHASSGLNVVALGLRGDRLAHRSAASTWSTSRRRVDRSGRSPLRGCGGNGCAAALQLAHGALGRQVLGDGSRSGIGAAKRTMVSRPLSSSASRRRKRPTIAQFSENSTENQPLCLSGARPTKIDTGTSARPAPDSARCACSSRASESNGSWHCAVRGSAARYCGGTAPDRRACASGSPATAPAATAGRPDGRRGRGSACWTGRSVRARSSRAAILEAGRIVGSIFKLIHGSAILPSRRASWRADGTRRQCRHRLAAAPGRPEGVSGAAGNGGDSVLASATLWPSSRNGGLGRGHALFHGPFHGGIRPLGDACRLLQERLRIPVPVAPGGRTVVGISPASGYSMRTTATSPFWLTRPVRRSAKVSSRARS